MSQKTKRKALAARMKQPSLVKKILLMNAHRAKRMLEMRKRKMDLLKLKKQNQNLHHLIYNLHNTTTKKMQKKHGRQRSRSVLVVNSKFCF